MTTDESIRARKTLKLRVDPENPLPVTKGEEFKETIKELIELAGKAPFHYESNEEQRSDALQGKEPWRFHVLDGESCRSFLRALNQEKPMKAPEGIRQMLAAADGLILATWLPERTRKLSRRFHPNLKNMEHIAATGAAIQNLWLAATSRGINAYWSSGGVIRKSKVMEFLGIPKDEILLGAVFLFPDEYPEGVETKTGKNAENRGEIGDFMDWIEVK
ncbi:MAG TPA: nitroreductase family protein [Gracilimonas sp.]|uniref:nitroreductase family protein n=1 Tax=Gracilimonas sp. TaxID=1974203 RepID=UPI002D934D03|nr:nitroreductase family protein [Gracilimonas sp.]